MEGKGEWSGGGWVVERKIGSPPSDQEKLKAKIDGYLRY